MNKEVIYIDTEDDITAIIGKIKASAADIVALVPPKRTGVLQSAVNLQLLKRTADTKDKKIVIVTTNKALVALSAVTKIPIAKNLQSKPEIIEVEEPESDENEDVIEGDHLPVGELAKTADIIQDDSIEESIETIDVEQDNSDLPKNINKNKVKVPDFPSFRKKLFIGIFVTICLIVFLVWANIYAPFARVYITAKTEPAPVSLSVKLGGTAATDVTKGIIQTVVKQTQKSVSVPFTATGQENVGEKATGVIKIENCDNTSSVTIPANTIFTGASGITFTNASKVVVPGLIGSSKLCQNTGVGAGSADVNVIATKPGISSNISSSEFSISGFEGYYIYAHSSSAMAGGTDKISTVVTAADIQKASQTLADLSSESIKQLLIKQFVNGESRILDSFTVTHAAAVSAPVLGAEAVGGKATLTSMTTYTMTAIAKSEIQMFIKNAINKQITNNEQKIYSDGINDVVLSGYLATDQGATVNISTTGKVGPNIDKNAIKQQVKGKQYGDAQDVISHIGGVSNVDIKFSYFWVTTIPNDNNKIDVQFILEDA